MFAATDTADAPWTVVKSNDKKRARLEAMRHVLSQVDYADRDDVVVGVPTRWWSGRLPTSTRRVSGVCDASRAAEAARGCRCPDGSVSGPVQHALTSCPGRGHPSG